jgi:hypothetical protein
MITQKELKARLDYDPCTGFFYWRTTIMRTDLLGKKAGCLHPVQGYIEIGIGNRLYKAHRLVWLYIHGYFPKKDIDHINRDRADNRLANLREVPRYQNAQNQTLRKTSKTGFMGVSFNTQKQKYIAQITVNKKKKYLGQYDCPKEAHQAYCEAKTKYHVFS